MEISAGLATIVAASISGVVAVIVTIIQNKKLNEKIIQTERKNDEKIENIEAKKEVVQNESARLDDTVMSLSARIDSIEKNMESFKYVFDSKNASAQVDKVYYSSNVSVDWIKIRDYLESIVESVYDGRTKAKYERIDRRNYALLVDALEADGMLNRSQAIAFKDAASLWHKYKRMKKNNGVVDETDAIAMRKAVALGPEKIS